MPDLSVSTVGQFVLYAAGAVAILLWSMRQGYGGIIGSLQIQNTAQQVQLDEQRRELRQLRRALRRSERVRDQKIAPLAAATEETATAIEELKKAVNGGPESEKKLP